MKNQSVNHKKYSDAYISYVENGYSAAVFIIRDTVQAISTKGMWIDAYLRGYRGKRYTAQLKLVNIK